MKKLTKQEKHEQCIREIRGTLVVVAICCVWHISSAFLLNGTGLYFLGMPAWFSVYFGNDCSFSPWSMVFTQESIH